MTAEPHKFFVPGSIWTLEDLLKAIDFGGLASDIWFLSTLTNQMQKYGFPLDSGEFLMVKGRITRLRRYLHDFDLATSATALDEIIERLDRVDTSDRQIKIEPVDFNHILGVLLVLSGTIGFEAKTKSVYVLDMHNAKRVNQETPAGGDVTLAFPSAAFDLAEASKCLGFLRSTACVFHSMRALETALSEVAQRLGATTLDKHGRGLPWGVILMNVREKVDDLQPGNARTQWQEIVATLASIKDAWRNETMHPKTTYTQEEAEPIFDLTLQFMRRLALILK